MMLYALLHWPDIRAELVMAMDINPLGIWPRLVLEPADVDYLARERRN